MTAKWPKPHNCPNIWDIYLQINVRNKMHGDAIQWTPEEGKGAICT
jgi:hypothetical protein